MSSLGSLTDASVEEFAKYLGSLSVDDLDLPDKEMVCLLPQDTVAKVMEIMFKYGILSVPIVKTEEDHTCVGFIDRRDLSAFLVSVVDKSGEGDDTQVAIKAASDAFFDNTVEELMNFSGRNDLVSMKPGTPLVDIMAELAKGTHRIAISDDDDKLVTVCSQSAVVKFLSKNLDKVGALAKKHVEELEIGLLGKVYSVENSETAINAFRFLAEKGISSAALVDAQGSLLGNVGSSDLKGIIPNNDITPVLLNVNKYINMIRSWSTDESVPSVDCTKNTGLSHVMLKLDATKVHRLWVIDSKFNPIGLISLTDVIKCLHTNATNAMETE